MIKVSLIHTLFLNLLKQVANLAKAFLIGGLLYSPWLWFSSLTREYFV